MSWNVDGRPVQPQAAIDWFRARLPLTDAEFGALSQEARSRAFFVGGLAQLDMVQEVFDALDVALSKGETFEDFKGRISQRISTAWGGKSPHRLRTVFDTNVQSAYGAGRWKAANDLKESRPFWGLAVVLDGRTSKICLNLRGVVRPADDPFWRNHIPPLHFRCRTALITFSREQAAREGVTEKLPDQPPLEGFGTPPGVKAFSPDETDYHPDLWAAYQRLQNVKPPAVEQERAKVKVHFTSVKSAVSSSIRDTVLRGAERAGMLDYLEKRPIPVEIVNVLRDDSGPVSGQYNPINRVIQISAQRSRAELVKRLEEKNWGGIGRVSDVASSVAIAMQKTLVHELSHDMLWRWADLLGTIVDVEARVRPVYNVAKAVSQRAAFSWREYFCETHAAYVYHLALLKQLDPAGYAIVEEARKALEIEVLS